MSPQGTQGTPGARGAAGQAQRRSWQELHEPRSAPGPALGRAGAAPKQGAEPGGVGAGKGRLLVRVPGAEEPGKGQHGLAGKLGPSEPRRGAHLW